MKWIPEFQDFDSVDIENAKLVLSEAEKNLQATEEDSDKLSTTAIYLLGAVIAILSACAAFMVKTFESHGPINDYDRRVFSVYAIGFLYIGIIAYRLVKGAFAARKIEHCGNSPKNLIKKEYLSLSHAALVLLEACSYQDRIEKNAKRNAETGIAINSAIKSLCAAPLVFILAWILSLFL